MLTKLNKRFKEFRKWWEDDIELYPKLKYIPHTILIISYNPIQKLLIEKNNIYDDDNIISDNEKFVKILSPILIKYFGSNYFVRSYYNNLPWIVEEDKKDKRLKKICAYLYRHKAIPNENFYIKRLKPFLKLFITYPSDFSVTPIVLIPILEKGIIIIDKFNTVVIGSQDLNLMEKLHKSLDSSGITVLKSTGIALVQNK